MTTTYVQEPIERILLDRQNEVDEVLNLACLGLSYVRDAPLLVKALKHPPEELQRSEEMAAIAARQVEQGFPLLFAQATIAAWGALETAIRDFLVRWLAAYPQSRTSERIGKLRVRFSDYEALEHEERMRFLLGELERDIGATLKPGIARFECLLAEIGLGGAIDDQERRKLLEMAAVRNVLVHRAGVADRRFVELCPWLNHSVGDQIVITGKEYHRFRSATLRYAASVLERAESLEEKYGLVYSPQNDAPQ